MIHLFNALLHIHVIHYACDQYCVVESLEVFTWSHLPYIFLDVSCNILEHSFLKVLFIKIEIFIFQLIQIFCLSYHYKDLFKVIINIWADLLQQCIIFRDDVSTQFSLVILILLFIFSSVLLTDFAEYAFLISRSLDISKFRHNYSIAFWEDSIASNYSFL